MLFKIVNVTYAYNDNIVFDNISVDIQKGEFLVLMGENGQGKSTFIDLIAGFKHSKNGEIYFKEEKIAKILKDNKRKQAFYSKIGILFQDIDIQLFNQTVYDEIAFGLRQMKMSEAEIEKRVIDVLKLLKIESLSHRIPYQLSGGEKKKVAFASIMVMNPEIYILDEPFNNLSKKSEELIKEILRELHHIGKTIILSSHHFKSIQEEKATILLFENGETHYYTPKEVQEHPAIQEKLSQY